MRKSLVSLSIIPFLFACANPQNPTLPVEEAPPLIEIVDNTIEKDSKDVVYARNWNEIYADGAWKRFITKITITPGAHFATNLNGCEHKEAYGAINLKTWNALAQKINQVANMEMLAEPRCIALPEHPSPIQYWDGTITLKKDDKNVQLFETTWEICTKIPDPKLADETMELLINVMTAAEREDCPSEWGRDY